MESKRYVADGINLRCPHCNRILNDRLLFRGHCPWCYGEISYGLAPRGRNCDNLDCPDCDYTIGCRDKLCDKRFLLEEP